MRTQAPTTPVETMVEIPSEMSSDVRVRSGICIQMMSVL